MDPADQRARLLPLLLLVLPMAWLLNARGEVIGGPNMDLVGHLSTMLHCSMGEPFRTTMVAWPHGADLLVIVGGWADIFLACPLVEPLGLRWAYNLVFVIYTLLAGVGGWVLARELGASRYAAVLAGLVLQLDGFVLRNMCDGRLEQGGVGLVALALAGAIHCWRHRSWWTAVGAGVAGAATVFASWELALFLALAVALLLPFLATGERAPGALARWGVAAALTALLAGPWALFFFERASEVRDLHEGLQTIEDARIASVGLLTALAGRTAGNPATLPLLALLALPWTSKARDRRLFLGLGGLLLLGLLLALGPDPGLLRAGDVDGLVGRGPYGWLQGLPVLGWFHTPNRFLCLWSLVAAVAAALAVDRLAAWRVWAGPALGVVILAVGVFEARWGGYLPHGGYHIPDHPGLHALAAVEGEGVVLDLPPREHRLHVLPYQAMQLTHRRPIPYHMTSPLLTKQGLGERENRNGFIRWFRAQVAGVPADPFERSDLVALRGYGYRWLVLNRQIVQQAAQERVIRQMRAELGPPDIEHGGIWMCWELPEGGQGGRVRRGRRCSWQLTDRAAEDRVYARVCGQPWEGGLQGPGTGSGFRSAGYDGPGASNGT